MKSLISSRGFGVRGILANPKSKLAGASFVGVSVTCGAKCGGENNE